jgi:group I intron endonuclease
MDINLLMYRDLISTNNGLDNYLRQYECIVYCISNEANGKIYIGKTKNSFNYRYYLGRWWEQTHNKILLEDVAKYGLSRFRVSILEKEVCEDDLSFIESLYILQTNSLHPNGYNLNYSRKSLVGEPTLNYRSKCKYVHRNRTRSLENRSHMSMRMSGEGNPRFGVKLSQETKNKIRDKAIGRKIPKDICIKNGLKQRGINHPRSKVVQQIDPVTNNILAEFASAGEAAREMKKPASCIVCSCLGTQKTSAGYIWRYKHETIE